MSLMTCPTAYFRVMAPMVAPIPAKPGQYLAFWMTHPDRTLSVIAADSRRTLRTANPPIGAVTGALLHLCIDGVILGLSPADELALREASQQVA